MEGKSELIILNPYFLGVCYGITNSKHETSMENYELIKWGGIYIMNKYVFVTIYISVNMLENQNVTEVKIKILAFENE